MARARTETIGYDVESVTTGERRVVLERSIIKATRVAGGYVTASRQYALFDTKGRRFERESANMVRCVTTGEQFRVHGIADKIRKVI
jgi:hypothetical protein